MTAERLVAIKAIILNVLRNAYSQTDRR